MLQVAAGDGDGGVLHGVGQVGIADFEQRGVQALARVAGGHRAALRLAARARWRRRIAVRAAACRPSWRDPVRRATGRCAAAAWRRAAARALMGAGGGSAAARRGAVRGAGAETRQRLLDRQQAAGLHQPQQPDLQVEARLQRGLQIPEQIERELQVARQILFGETRRRSAPASRAARRWRRPGAYPRRRSGPPADCGSSATARG